MRAITAVKGELSSKTKTKFSQWLQKNYITQVRVQDFVRGGGGGLTTSEAESCQCSEVELHGWKCHSASRALDV